MQLRKDMGRSLESSRIEAMVGDSCNVGYLARSVSRRIFHYIRVVGLRSTVHRKHRHLGMFARAFLRSM